MKKLALFLSVVLLSLTANLTLAADQQASQIPPNMVVQGIPDIPEDVINRMNQYLDVRNASFSDWDPHGPGILISTRFGETNQLFYVDHPGGARRQLTFYQEPVYSGTFCAAPGKNGFMFSRDVGGGEFYQLYYFDLQSGKERMLTDGKSRNEGRTWSNDGTRYAYTSTARNGKDYDIWLAEIDRPGSARLAYEVEGAWDPLDWSPDDSKILVQNYISINESDIYILDSRTSQMKILFPKTGEQVSYGSAMWSKDGKGIFYLTDHGSDFVQLHYMDLATSKDENLTADITWDVEQFDLSPDGKLLAFAANEDGMGKLRVIDIRSKKEISFPLLPVGQLGGVEFKPDNSALALTINTPRSPSDVYTLDMKSKKLTRWTYSELGGLNTENFPEPTLVHYPTFDKVGGKTRAIPCFYFKPNVKTGQPFPVIIYVHGGPESQYNPSFSSTFQYWLNELGIAVLAPNVRGSAGYGKEYLKLDNGFLRENTIKDIGALLDWIEKQPELDKNRVGIYGGSYGGYMVLGSMFNYNNRLKAGVEAVGISNFVTFLENTQEYRRDLRRQEYGDERDPKMREHLLAISPTTNAGKITKPLLVAQGANDPRVPAGEAEQIVETVRKNGGEVWYMLAKDEGHGFLKKNNRDYYYNAVSLFWEKYLLDRREKAER